MKETDFDTTFDAGEEVRDWLDIAAARRPMRDTRRVHVDVPVWMMEQLDREAQRLGVTLQSVIKFWLSERLEVIHKRRGTEITSSR